VRRNSRLDHHEQTGRRAGGTSRESAGVSEVQAPTSEVGDGGREEHQCWESETMADSGNRVGKRMARATRNGLAARELGREQALRRKGSLEGLAHMSQAVSGFPLSSAR